MDPYEYVRNMGKGASMEPIRSKTASNFESASHSDALILWKNSQSTKLMNLAKKKSIIPQPGKQKLLSHETYLTNLNWNIHLYLQSFNQLQLHSPSHNSPWHQNSSLDLIFHSRTSQAIHQTFPDRHFHNQLQSSLRLRPKVMRWRKALVMILLQVSNSKRFLRRWKEFKRCKIGSI